MKFKNILMSISAIFALVLAMAFVSAAVDVTYNAYHATIEEDGSISYSTQQVSDYDSAGYVCTAPNCASIGAQLSGQTRSTNTNSITLTYPTVLQNPNGYVSYFYKDGYIGWEDHSNWQGTGNGGTQDIYLLKLRTGYAPIMGLDVVNEVNPGLPVEVGVEVGIDADTYSAIEDATVAPIPLNENVRTQVVLEIRDRQNQLVYTDSRTVDVPYSGSMPVSFTYSGFSETGDYTVKVITNLVDAKILEPKAQQAKAEIEVVPFGDTDYAYTIINRLEMNPVYVDEGDTVDFSFGYLSNYVETDGSLTPIDTRIEVSIFRNSREIEDSVYYEGASGTLSFSYTFDKEGSYVIEIKGEPDNAEDYEAVVKDTDEIRFTIGESADEEDEEDQDSSKHKEEEFGDSAPLVTSAGAGEEPVDLTGEKTSTLKTACWIIFWAILAMIVLIGITAAVKFA